MGAVPRLEALRHAPQREVLPRPQERRKEGRTAQRVKPSEQQRVLLGARSQLDDALAETLWRDLRQCSEERVHPARPRDALWALPAQPATQPAHPLGVRAGLGGLRLAAPLARHLTRPAPLHLARLLVVLQEVDACQRRQQHGHVVRHDPPPQPRRRRRRGERALLQAPPASALVERRPRRDEQLGALSERLHARDAPGRLPPHNDGSRQVAAPVGDLGAQAARVLVPRLPLGRDDGVLGQPPRCGSLAGARAQLCPPRLVLPPHFCPRRHLADAQNVPVLGHPQQPQHQLRGEVQHLAVQPHHQGLTAVAGLAQLVLLAQPREERVRAQALRHKQLLQFGGGQP